MPKSVTLKTGRVASLASARATSSPRPEREDDEHTSATTWLAGGRLWGTGTGGGEGPTALSWRTNGIRAERTVAVFFAPVKMSCVSLLEEKKMSQG
jgi:hypothetical protein